ncbi:hypothetical protein [Spirosoma utsteinense]|uniref:Bulb-type lectin domain-containing protein n=1 Tax=Spirosoma utsteinense TaxID=2585773 RepID=A0ABR6W3U0_9BACT|nr:hypothetical protein [Spirosoma utsteinense]MBC3791208.1 hypothetical protein [Spirosoma utsteinense]
MKMQLYLQRFVLRSPWFGGLLLTTVLYLGTVMNLSAQTIEWQKTFGGTRAEFATATIETSDGSYLVAGTTESTDGQVSGNHGQVDVWIIKINKSGNLVWQKTYGGTNFEWIWAITEAPDGGYALAGYTLSNDGDVSGNHGGTDVWVIKIDDAGNLLWQKTLGGTGTEQVWAIKQAPEGGYILAGSTDSNDGQVSGNHGQTDLWLVRLSNVGELLWQKTLGGTGHDNARSITSAIEGGYTIAGSTSSSDGDVSGGHPSGDAWVVHVNGSGDLVWQKTYGGAGFESFNAILTQPDGSYILTGNTSSTDGDVSGNHGNNDVWLVKLNQTGSLIRQKTFGGSDSDYGVSVLTTADGGLVIAADASSTNGDVTGNHGIGDFWVFKLDNAWNLLWQKALGGSQYEFVSSIILPKEGGYLLVGETYSNDGEVTGSHGFSEFWVVKIRGGIQLLPPSYDCGSGQITFNTSGGDGSPVTYQAPGITRAAATDAFGTVEAELRADPKPITIWATQAGHTSTFVFDLAAACSSPGGALSLLLPTYDCQTGAFRFNVRGGDGSPVEYRAVPGITDWTTNPNAYVDREIRTAADAPPIILQARQRGREANLDWNIRGVCPVGGRLGAAGGSPTDRLLQMRVWGNPVESTAIEVEVSGETGQSAQLSLTSQRGQVLYRRAMHLSGAADRVSVPVGAEHGLLLLDLRSTTDRQQIRTIRILAQ